MDVSEFNIKRYIENSEKMDQYLKPKLKYFLMYLKEEIGDDVLEEPHILGTLDKEYLLDSLEFYIKNVSPSRQTANDYIRAITRLIELVCEDYEVKNHLFASVAMRAEFNEEAKERINHLREKTNRESMSDEEFELLDEKINDFFNTNNLSEQVTQSIENDTKKPNYYSQLVSAIALRLVQKYGLGNNIISNLTTGDLCVENRTLEVNGIKLFLSEELAFAFELYNKARKLVVHNHNSQTDKLFVKKDGTPYLAVNNQADNNGLFFLMESAIGHKKVGGFRYRTIIELVLKGANIGFLSLITGVNEKTIAKICCDNDAELKENFERMFIITNHTYRKREKKQKKGLLQCPYCGRFKDASAENWILIQVEGEEKKYLSCKECGGCDGKYNY